MWKCSLMEKILIQLLGLSELVILMKMKFKKTLDEIKIEIQKRLFEYMVRKKIKVGVSKRKIKILSKIVFKVLKEFKEKRLI